MGLRLPGLGEARGLPRFAREEQDGLGDSTGKAQHDFDAVAAAAAEGVVDHVGGDEEVVGVVGEGRTGFDVGLTVLALEGVREVGEARPFLGNAVEADGLAFDEIGAEGGAVGPSGARPEGGRDEGGVRDERSE